MKSAFPSHLVDDVAAVTELLRPPKYPASADNLDVVLGGELLHIPARVYFPEIVPSLGRLSSRQAAILACIYSRHHDGHVRERALERIIGQCEPWITPYVVQLLGEYVVEIIRIIEQRIPEACAPTYGSFLDENPSFGLLMRQRAFSYWDCYYRSEYPRSEDYPALRVLARLESWRKSVATNRGAP